MDNWDDLRIIRAVVRAGSITAGAQRLGIDQSTVSRRLQNFEQRFGKRLFSDSKKREHLTKFGKACAESAFRMAQETEKLEKTLAENDKAFEGTITILAADFLSNRLLVSVVSDFLENYPKINLRVSTEPSESGGFDADVALIGFAVRKVCQLHEVQHVLSNRVCLIRTLPETAQPKRHVFQNCHMRKQRVMLKDSVNRPCLWRKVRNIFVKKR